jgi:hypothetical protein
MLTIRAIRTGGGAQRVIWHGDYYAEGERAVGYWYDGRAAELELVGDVTAA